MSRYEAILFDFDGVLVDSEPVHFVCWQELLQPFGLTLDWQTYCEQGIGVSDRAMLANPAFSQTAIDLLDGLSGYKLVVATSSGWAEVEPI